MIDRARHHVANESAKLSECLRKHFGLAPARADELIGLGSIYVNKERMEQDRPLAKGDHVQAYLQPTRFELAGIDWRNVIVHEETLFLVVNKPSGIPVHATADNLKDNLLHQLRTVCGIDCLVTQRLDTPVSGLMVLAKTRAFQREFNDILAARRAKKTYMALTVKDVPAGRHVHYMPDTETTPKVLSEKEGRGLLRCELEVLRSEKKFINDPNRPFTEVTVNLLTGRTHQIRAQLSTLGAPVVGDKLYGSTVRYSKLKVGRGIALFSQALEWNGRRFEAAPPWRSLTPQALH